MNFRIPLFALIAAVLVLVSGCQRPAQLRVEDAYVQLSPIEGRPSAGYFVIHGGPQPVSLRGVVTPSALRLEMHETVDENGVSMMRPIDRVEVPAAGEVKFEPGGRHIMLFGIDGGALKAGELPLEFIFSNGDRILVTAPLRRTGSAGAAE